MAWIAQHFSSQTHPVILECISPIWHVLNNVYQTLLHTHWALVNTNTCTYPSSPKEKIWQPAEAKVRTTYWQTKSNPALQASLEVHSVLCISKDKFIFRFEADSACQTQSVSWHMLPRTPVSPSFLYLLHGNSQLCLQPSLCCSPNTNGIIFFQFLRMAQRVTATSVGKTICNKFNRFSFDTYKDLGKKPKKPQHQNPPGTKASYLTHPSFISVLQTRVLTPLIFLYIFCTGICLCQALLCRLLFYTHEDRHSYPQHIYSESQ